MQRVENQINCAYIDSNTMACYSPSVDANDDGMISAEEWNDADVEEKGILESTDVADESEIFESEGDYGYEGLYESEGMYEDGNLYYEDEGLYEDLDIYNDTYEYGLFDEEDDGAFE